jgi:hypothetical protein
LQQVLSRYAAQANDDFWRITLSCKSRKGRQLAASSFGRGTVVFGVTFDGVEDEHVFSAPTHKP